MKSKKVSKKIQFFLRAVLTYLKTSIYI